MVEEEGAAAEEIVGTGAAVEGGVGGVAGEGETEVEGVVT